ncbi:MAG: hypothetical protein ABEI86_07205 [Halobacteriaceae archaeon]
MTKEFDQLSHPEYGERITYNGEFHLPEATILQISKTSASGIVPEVLYLWFHSVSNHY